MKKIIYPFELFFFLYVSLSERKKITSSFGVDYFLPLPLFLLRSYVKSKAATQKADTVLDLLSGQKLNEP